MKANNLSISIPNKDCDMKGHCQNYCVSKMTGKIECNESKINRNIPKVKKLVEIVEITSVSLTGKGEPCLNMESIYDMLDAFRDYPLELQTNGIYLSNNLERLESLERWGLDILAISLDSVKQFEEMLPLFNKVNELGMTNRVTFNIVNPEYNGFDDFAYLLSTIKLFEIDQLSLRQIVVPNFTKIRKENNWIEENVEPKFYEKLNLEMTKKCEKEGQFLRQLAYGAKLYDLCGVSVTAFDYCIQDSSVKGDDIRSLIFLEDGHMYLTWNSKASRIF